MKDENNHWLSPDLAFPTLGALIFGCLGFIYAGIGGALLGIILGALIGEWLIGAVLFYGLLALLIGLVFAIIGLIVWVTQSLWNVGKP